MDTFVKNPGEIYELVYDFSNQLSAGEIIKTYDIYLNNVLLSGIYPSGDWVYTGWSGEFPDWSGVLPSGYSVIPSGAVISTERYDKDTVIVGVGGAYDYQMNDVSGFMVSAHVHCNTTNTYTRDIWIELDATDPTPTYNDLYYRIQTSWDDKTVYILPRLGDSWKYNQEYSVQVLPGLSGVINYTMSTPYTFWFTSRYCPLFSTPQAVKLLGGPTVEAFSDDTVYRMIHKNSMDAMDIAGINSGENIPYNKYGCGPDGIPYELRRYVECKTAYDLLTLARMVNSAGYSQTKLLGDMRISYGGAPSSSSNTSPDRTKELYDCFMGLMNNLTKGEGIKYAVRGYNDYSKGYSHPMKDLDHNRIVRSVPPHRSNLRAPYTEGRYWRWRSSNFPRTPFQRGRM